MLGGIGKVYPAQIADEVKSVFLKNVLVGCIFLVIASSATSSDALPSGAMEGHLKFVSLGAAESSDAMPRQTVTPEKYAEYPLVVFSQDGKREIVRVTADGNGNYRVPLPPGAYILDLQDRVARHLRAKPQPFTVVSDQTVCVDMNIVIGFARGAL